MLKIISYNQYLNYRTLEDERDYLAECVKTARNDTKRVEDRLENLVAERDAAKENIEDLENRILYYRDTEDVIESTAEAVCDAVVKAHSELWKENHDLKRENRELSRNLAEAYDESGDERQRKVDTHDLRDPKETS